MANKYRGEVEFTDSEGKSYVLRLGVNQYISIEHAVQKLDGLEWQRRMFHAALTHGAESQKNMTLDEVGDLMDDLGMFRVDELIKQTRFGQMSAETLAKAKEAADAARKKEGAANPPETPSSS